MRTPSKTIDDLGIDVSKRYATSDQSNDSTYIKEASHVTTQAKRDRNVPTYSPELVQVLHTDEKNRPFADTNAPAGFETQTNAAYLHTYLPSVGQNDKIEANIHRLQNFIQKLKQELEKATEGKQINMIENEIIQAQNLLNLLELVLDMSKIKGEIEGARRKSQKG